MLPIELNRSGKKREWFAVNLHQLCVYLTFRVWWNARRARAVCVATSGYVSSHFHFNESQKFLFIVASFFFLLAQPFCFMMWIFITFDFQSRKLSFQASSALSNGEIESFNNCERNGLIDCKWKGFLWSHNEKRNFMWDVELEKIDVLLTNAICEASWIEIKSWLISQRIKF